MTELGDRFGSYRITREAGHSPVGDRFLAVDERDDRCVMIHVLAVRRAGAYRRRAQAALEACAAATTGAKPHLLEVGAWGFWGRDRLAWVTAYPGASGGPVTLRELARARGGRLPAGEARRAVEQLWSGATAAHAAGYSQGAADLGGVLVDPGGQVWFENYGLAAELAEPGSLAVTPERRRLELLSLAGAFVELTTGFAPPIPAGAARFPIPRIPHAWVDAFSGVGEDVLAAAFTTLLRAEDASPDVVSALRRGVEAVQRAEGAAAEAASDAAWAAAKGALRAATGVVRRIFGQGR